MVRVQSEYVVKFEDVFLEPYVQDGFNMNYLCIAMEYCPNGDLNRCIQYHLLITLIRYNKPYYWGFLAHQQYYRR